MTERELFETWAERQNIELHKVTPCDGSEPYYGLGSGAWVAWQAGRAPLLARIAELENELLAQHEKNVLLTVCLRQFEDGEGK